MSPLELVLILILGYLFVERELRDRRHRLHLDQLGAAFRDQEQVGRRERAAFLGVLAAERRENLEQMEKLLNRIQHPKVYQPSREQLDLEKQLHEEHVEQVDDEFEAVGTAGAMIVGEQNGN